MNAPSQTNKDSAIIALPKIETQQLPERMVAAVLNMRRLSETRRITLMHSRRNHG
jgi:hypothetical protein